LAPNNPTYWSQFGTITVVYDLSLRNKSAVITINMTAVPKLENLMGPLSGIKVLEIDHVSTDPICGMLLADMGADVISVEKRSAPFDQPRPRRISSRGRSSIALDLKTPGGLETILRLVGMVDVFLDGLEPGTTENLGIGPVECLATNPEIVYGRLNRWGQTSSLYQAAGNEMNHQALSEVLPTAFLSLMDDFGSGTLLAFGILCALFEVRHSSRGQVVDASTSDVVDFLTSLMNESERKQHRQSETVDHPRQKTYSDPINVDGMIQPAPIPHFSRTQPEVLWGPQRAGEETEAVLQDFGFDPQEIIQLRESGVLP
jgi:crotonobetainyl-CoA:carnitine CoA-transferase CaiB-like acyl-CoA transferase